MSTDEEIHTNLVKIVVAQLPDLPPERREEVSRILNNPTEGEIDLDREGDDILFRIGETVFHIPVLWLTAPMHPGDARAN